MGYGKKTRSSYHSSYRGGYSRRGGGRSFLRGILLLIISIFIMIYFTVGSIFALIMPCDMTLKLIALIFLVAEGYLIRYKYKQYEYESKCQNEEENIEIVSSSMSVDASGDFSTADERLMYEQLKIFEPWGAKFVSNCLLEKENGQTTEIDMILITRKGVFVFENKDYNGWIFGRADDDEWTASYASGWGSSKKYRFYNPIKQNTSRILVSFLIFLLVGK